MNRPALFSGALLLAVASIAVNELHAAPPLRPPSVSPNTVSTASTARQRLHPPRTNVQAMPRDTPHPTLATGQTADGPTLVLEPVAPAIAGKASLLLYASGEGTSGLFSAADNAIEVRHQCPPNGICNPVPMAGTEVAFARDPKRGYYVTCLLANTGSKPVDVQINWSESETVQTVAPGHSSWLTHHYEPNVNAGNLLLLTFGNSPDDVRYSITRCEIMPYVPPRG
jgi:hypothetical protein